MSEKQDPCCGGSCHTSEVAKTAAVKHSEVTIRPRYTSRYDDEAWEVAVRLPGVAKDEVDVSIENEILEVVASWSNPVPEGWQALVEYPTERRYQLRLDVGPEVDPERISAFQEDGVLTLRLPLKEASKPTTIAVS